MDTVLLYVLGIVLVVIGFVISVGLHEFGHLIPAKLFGVKVGQYMIGFGPTLFSKRFRGTQYGVKAIPLGGYISMAGMFPPAKPGAAARTASTGFFNTLVQDARDSSADTIKEGEEEHVFYKLPVGKRIIIMLGGPAMNFVLAIVFYAIVLCGFGIPVPTTTIGSVSQCVLPAGSTQTSCGPTDALSPASAAGLQPGDTLVSVAGTAVTSWAQATSIIQKSPNQTIPVVVTRAGQQLTLSVTPTLASRPVVDANGTAVKDANGVTVTQSVGFVGMGYATANQQQPVTAVLPQVGSNIATVAQAIVNLPQRLYQVAQAAFGGAQRDPNGLMSVVGVGRLAGEITSLNSVPIADRAANIIGIFASLNVALGVFNLIPLMPLDGGHVLGALWEALRRGVARLRRRPDPGPFDSARFVPVTLGVSVVLGAMSLLLIYADIVNPISIG